MPMKRNNLGPDDSAKPEEERRVSRQMFPGLEWTAMGLSGYGAVRRTHWPADGVTPRLPGASTGTSSSGFLSPTAK